MRLKGTIRGTCLGCVAAILPALIIWAYFSQSAALTVLVVMTLLGAFVHPKNTYLLAGAIAVGSLIVIVGVGLLPDIYYRPHEKYDAGGRYQPNINITFPSPFGDLVAIGGYEFRSAGEPRSIEFVTDGKGFRNRDEYRKGDTVVLGDSFVAGNGLSQENLIGERLTKHTGETHYAIAFPANFVTYAKMLADHGLAAYVFVFEGNDFDDGDCTVFQPRKRKWQDEVRTGIPLATKTIAYKKKAARAWRAMKKRWRGTVPAPRVSSRRVGSTDLLFLDHYVAITRRESFMLPACVDEAFSAVRHLVRGFVFLPTKYRIYAPHLDESPEKDLSDAQWEATERLARTLGVPAYDMTPHLAKAAETALVNGRFVYWRDGTHWNGLGTKTVAESLADLFTTAD